MSATEIDIPDAVQELMRELLPRPARYRYFAGMRGEMFCWSVEPVDGKFACWTYKPYGKGSRSGNAVRFRMTDKIEFTKRKTAKSHAYNRFLGQQGRLRKDNYVNQG